MAFEGLRRKCDPSPDEQSGRPPWNMQPIPPNTGNTTMRNSNDTTDDTRTYNYAKHNEFKHSNLHGTITFGDTINYSSNENDPLFRLPCADNAAFNSQLWEHKPLCLQGTRANLIQEILTWSQSASSPCIFWLSGMAGTGKSTIARTVARHFAAQNRLGASFFFSRGAGDLGNATKFFTTLAVQLANTLPTLKPYVCRAIADNPDISRRALAEQWKYLISQPLANLQEVSHQSQQFSLVIDALDECDNEDDTQLILRLLSQSNTPTTARLQVFLTSRPETCIHFGFRKLSDAAHHDVVLHSIPQSIIQEDISIFLHDELEKIRCENNFPSGWPGKETIDDLCLRSNGLFIYASTACRFIQDPLLGPEDGLRIILQNTYRGLDEMYAGILRHSIIYADRYKAHRTQLSSEIRQIVGSIIIFFDTLPVTMLARLLAMSVNTVHSRLRCLHSVLDVPEDQVSPIRLLHPSFRDFLLDQERCADPQFWIDEKKAHSVLFLSCLKLMSEHLKRDMCNLRLPGTLTSKVEKAIVETCIPLDVQYACCYWVHHLQRGKMELSDNHNVYKFLQEHFLHWLEALSLIGRLSDGVLVIRTLESMLTSDGNHHLRAMARDAVRFVLKWRPIIEIAPLQIYCSALTLSPKRSILREQFWNNVPRWINKPPAVPEDWDAMLQVFEGHSDSVRAVAFSPDGKLLASASDDKTVRLWDLTTGTCSGTLKDHSDHVWAVTFSPDGKLLASASDDKTVRLWDPTTGTCSGTLKGHSDWVQAVAFSPDGKLLASASDKTVRLWDPTTGICSGTLKGHSDYVWAVAFSPDGKLLASASCDKTVRLWDPTTGTCSGNLKGHWNVVRAVAFSPDGKLLASASDDKTVRLWDPTTGTSRGTLMGHSNRVWAVAFSPDGKLLASASWDSTVRLWDPTTGACSGTLKGHSDHVWAVTFSPDGKLLASDDKTVRLWDPTTGTCSGTLKGHSDRVQAVAFSPDGKLLASASDDKTVRLWEVTMGVASVFQVVDTTRAIRQLETHEGIVQFTDAPRSESHFRTRSPSTLCVNEDWISSGLQNIFWLPPDYRANCSAVRNNIIALGHLSGRVSFLEVDLDSIPKE